MELMGNAIAFATIADILFVLRMINRTFIMKSVRAEDYLMTLTMVPYTALLVLINISAKHDTNLFPMGMRDKIMSNPVEVAGRIRGSKLVVVLEHMMLLTTWGVKACFLLFIARITERVPKYKLWLRILTLYVIIGFLALEIVFYFGACRPFNQYWAVPVTNLQCSTYAIYSIVQVCLNITSDFGLILMLMIIVSQMQLTRIRRLTLLLPFGMGFFTVLAALLSAIYGRPKLALHIKSYTMRQTQLTTAYQLWYIRESSVSIWVANILCTWPLIQKVLKLRPFNIQPTQPMPPVRQRPTVANDDFVDSMGRPSGHWRNKFLSAQLAAGNLFGITPVRDSGASRFGTPTRAESTIGLTAHTVTDANCCSSPVGSPATPTTIGMNSILVATDVSVVSERESVFLGGQRAFGSADAGRRHGLSLSVSHSFPGVSRSASADVVELDELREVVVKRGRGSLSE
ncbi:hypothetical protein B0J14DRAFT_514157 [Halenospora varia]|nr:hypothetical protein B0J14DRAFT_514157 [Halenospora varia]